jgi:diketogulonate reductase-like aldo/keto reductase
MKYMEIAPGEEIPVLGLGTWTMGGRQVEDHTWDEENIQAIRVAIELGLTHIDTAEHYGAGHAEELVGKAIEPYDRDELFITTKVWRTNLHYDDVIQSMKGSLKRLGLEYVDLFLQHWPNPRVPLNETMRALEHCAVEGYTRYIGVSNFSEELMREAQGYLEDHSLVANQVEYSLTDQKPNMNLLPYMQNHNKLLVAYTPLAKGKLAKPGYQTLDKMAEKYDKSQAQIALNWLITQENVVAIPKSSNPVHLLDIAGAIEFELSEADALILADSFI